MLYDKVGSQAINLSIKDAYGLFYEYSKTPKEGFVKEVTSKGQEVYRKYYNQIRGVIKGLYINNNGNFGPSLSIRIVDGDETYFLGMNIYMQSGGLSSWFVELASYIEGIEPGAIMSISMNTKEKQEGKDFLRKQFFFRVYANEEDFEGMTVKKMHKKGFNEFPPFKEKPSILGKKQYDTSERDAVVVDIIQKYKDMLAAKFSTDQGGYSQQRQPQQQQPQQQYNQPVQQHQQAWPQPQVEQKAPLQWSQDPQQGNQSGYVAPNTSFSQQESDDLPF